MGPVRPNAINGTMKLSFDVPTFADVDKEFNYAISNYSGQSCEEFVPSGKAMYRTLLATCGTLPCNENELLTHTSNVRYVFHR